MPESNTRYCGTCGQALPENGGLTPREVEVLTQLAAGAKLKEIGARLSISPRTVGNHIANIYECLGVDNRVSAARWFWEHEAELTEAAA